VKSTPALNTYNHTHWTLVPRGTSRVWSYLHSGWACTYRWSCIKCEFVPSWGEGLRALSAVIQQTQLRRLLPTLTDSHCDNVRFTSLFFGVG